MFSHLAGCHRTLCFISDFNALSISISDDNIFQTEAPSVRLWPPPGWPVAAAPRVTWLMTGQSRKCEKMSKILLSRGNKRRLVDSCGHDRCFSCIGRNENCALCSQMAGQLQTRPNSKNVKLQDRWKSFVLVQFSA